MSYTHFQNWIYKASTTHYIGSGAPSSIGTAIDVSVTLTNLRLSMKIQRIDFVSGEVKLQVKQADHPTTITSPLESMGGPLFYRTSTTNIVMISPPIFMSASFVYLCLTCDHRDTCWMHCTS